MRAGKGISRRGYARGVTGSATAAVLAALGVALRAAHAQEADAGLMPPAAEEARPRVPALEKTILLDADWIGTDNARGRHAQFWIDTWAQHHPTYKLDFQAAGDTIVRLGTTYKVKAVRPDDPSGITVLDLRRV